MQFLLLILIFLLILADVWLLARRPHTRPSVRTSPLSDKALSTKDFREFIQEVFRSSAAAGRREDVKPDFICTGDPHPTAVPPDRMNLIVIFTHLFTDIITLTPTGGNIRVEAHTTPTSLSLTVTGGIPEELPARLSVELPIGCESSGSAATVAATQAEPTALSSPQSLETRQAIPSGPITGQPEHPAAERKPEILVVTDNAESAGLLCEGLSADFNVTTTGHEDGSAPLSSAFHPDIILTDRRLTPVSRLESVPLVLLTDKQGDEATVETLTSGADDCITIPVDMDHTILTIKRLVGLTHSSSPLISPDPGNSEVPPLDGVMLEKAVKYVVTNIRRTDLSVEELSAHLGMSRVHLYKKLKAATGKTPIEFIRLIRMKRGAQMLRERRRNITEIAFQLGYNTPKIFSRYFKEEFGVLPSVYQS